MQTSSAAPIARAERKAGNVRLSGRLGEIRCSNEPPPSENRAKFYIHNIAAEENFLCGTRGANMFANAVHAIETKLFSCHANTFM